MPRTLVSLVVLALLGAAPGCASLQSVSLTQIPPDRSRPIKLEVHDWSFLGIQGSNDFINGIGDDLRRQCPEGAVQGVLTKHENFLYVLMLKRVVRVSAYCVKAIAVAPRAPIAPSPWDPQQPQPQPQQPAPEPAPAPANPTRSR